MNTEERVINDLFDDEIEINIFELLFVLRQRILVIIAAFLVGAVLAGLYTVRFIAPTFSAYSMIYISTKTTSITSLADLQLGSQLAVDFQIVGTTREVLESVIENMGLTMSYEEIRSKVNIYSPTGSHILRIDVVDTDPQRAADISNTLADELRARIADVMNTDTPSMVERAVVPQYKVGPNVPRNTILLGMLFAIAASAVIIVFHLLDDTIHTEEDIKRYLKLNNLAMIPMDKSRPANSPRTKLFAKGKR